MSAAKSNNPETPFLEQLFAAANHGAGDKALIFKYRGSWRSLTWRAALDEIDAIAAGLKKLGVTPGGTVAFDGEITVTLLLAAAATRAIGAQIRSVPLSASADDLDAIVLDPSVQLAVGQGRETVAEWSAASAGKRDIAIVLDHAVPDSRSPAENIVTIRQLRELAAKSGWASSIGSSRKQRASHIAWFEETTDWNSGLEIILSYWTTSRAPLALPETLIAATRDRSEMSPALWISSTERLEAAWLHASDRISAPDSLAGRLTRAALQGAAAPWHAYARARLRRSLGFRRLKQIDLKESSPGVITHEARAFYTGLNLRLVGNEQQEKLRPPRKLRADESQFHELALASAASR